MEKLSELQKNILLKNYTTFKIGGPAEYFLIAKKKEDLINAINLAKKSKLKLSIFGGGSNLLVADKGVKGLIIKIENNIIKRRNNLIFAGAGTKLESLARFCKKNNLAGLEWAAGIPGATVGGAVFGNAQAFGTKTSSLVKSVEALDTETLKFINFSKNKCNFGLKSSIFKNPPSVYSSPSKRKLIIISVVFYFKKGRKKEMEGKIKEFLNYRKSHHPLNFPSAGSVFINPEVKIKDKKMIEKFPELAEFNKKGFIHAGYLIEKTGLKGKKIGRAQISEKHANFIINLGGAKAKDVLKLISLVKTKVKKKFGIELEPEIKILGF